MSSRPRGPWSTNTHPETAMSFHVRGELYFEFLLRTRHMAIYITRTNMVIKISERFFLLFFLHTIAVHFKSYIYLDLISSHQESDVWSEYYSCSVHFRTSSGVRVSCQTQEEKGGFQENFCHICRFSVESETSVKKRDQVAGKHLPGHRGIGVRWNSYLGGKNGRWQKLPG